MVQRIVIIGWADANRQHVDGTIGPIKQIVDSEDIVFAVWPDADERDGASLLIVKGRCWHVPGLGDAVGHRCFLRPGGPPLTFSAVPCRSLAHAIASQHLAGEPEPETEELVRPILGEPRLLPGDEAVPTLDELAWGIETVIGVARSMEELKVTAALRGDANRP